MADSRNKRKRTTDDPSNSSKKVAIQAPSHVKTVKISVMKDPNDWAPVVGMIYLVAASTSPVHGGRKSIALLQDQLLIS